MLDIIVSTPIETVDIGEAVTAKGVVPEVSMEVEGISQSLHRYPIHLDQGLPRTQEGTKEKKGNQAATPLVHMSPKRNRPKDKPTS